MVSLTEAECENKNEIIKRHLPFIIKTVSEITGRYVTLEQDEVSIALLAFNEAIDKYEKERGPFLAFAKLVMTSRLLTYLKRENKQSQHASLDELHEAGIELTQDVCQPMVESQSQLKQELNLLKEQLKPFGFDLEALATDCPKHRDTRQRAITLSRNITEEKSIVQKLYEKYRLPIKLISVTYQVTEKFIKGNKKFIITVVIMFDKNYKTLLQWVLK